MKLWQYSCVEYKFPSEEGIKCLSYMNKFYLYSNTLTYISRDIQSIYMGSPLFPELLPKYFTNWWKFIKCHLLLGWEWKKSIDATLILFMNAYHGRLQVFSVHSLTSSVVFIRCYIFDAICPAWLSTLLIHMPETLNLSGGAHFHQRALYIPSVEG